MSALLNDFMEEHFGNMTLAPPQIKERSIGIFERVSQICKEQKADSNVAASSAAQSF
ncbi:hypothetical protein WJ0W_005526 [Paenibacillus melissococcoides]|uniref:Uncharacterized protein n=1 Tax=Paenibacillus melissococcoides TaxID=2912268 RepID=A0ABM9G8I2_9BACL|nr:MULTISPECIES: hypothetical protein [Paenibacillus]MEB9892470.1 hypothetical protein [Bacillus cereus]CAH8248269.1 hypothetical protein WJ0W_005526 [Paenibacillus melissococcoides]CAH8717987.1 hypothetical protein HTL2_005125 [Paenibacillus melissococcoides]CAH8719134.1 hypothetical protein WDD9_005448 [Paenibacillus melissococcoides]